MIQDVAQTITNVEVCDSNQALQGKSAAVLVTDEAEPKAFKPTERLAEFIAATAFIGELQGKTTAQLKEIVMKTPNSPELEEGERLLLVVSIKILQGRMPKKSYNTFLLEVVEAARQQ